MSFLSSFLKKKDEPPVRRYDPEKLKPAIRCSICTGEQVAGFFHLDTGNFEEVSLLMKEGDLEAFKKKYGVEGEVERFY